MKENPGKYSKTILYENKLPYLESTIGRYKCGIKFIVINAIKLLVKSENFQYYDWH